MWYKQVGTDFFRSVTLHAFNGRTDGRTDISLMAKTALHRCSAVIGEAQINKLNSQW